ncbi:MAG TPA: VWA domain-containing protein [Mycobacteriales bacterium]|nr:VWA domain-containing protein [Mycobacteriales bacterium]
MPSLPTNWSFQDPWRLLLLLAVAAVIAGYVLLQRRRSVYATRFSDVELLASVMPRRPGWRRHLPASLLVLTLVALTTGFARPQADVRVPRARATIVVALDVSASMQATDVSPTRLQAAQAGAIRFVRSLPKTFDVGLVSFSAAAAVIVAPTLDHAAVETGIGSLGLGGGTAIGDAVASSVAAAQASQRSGAAPGTPLAPARIVLLSDGGNTVGQSVDQGAAQAIAAGIPVSTIAYGTDTGVVVVRGRAIPVPVDAPALARLASTTGGTAYTAASGDQLNNVYRDIGRQVGTMPQRHEMTAALTGLGLLLGLAAAAASLVWFRALP